MARALALPTVRRRPPVSTAAAVLRTRPRPPDRPHPGHQPGPAALARLQRAAGNRAVARLLASAAPAVQPATPSGCAGGAGLGHDVGTVDPVGRRRSTRPPATAEAVQRQDGSGPATGCATRCGGIPSACPPSFCCPFPLGTATLIRNQITPLFLAGIASQVNASVVPVWATWFSGGSGVQDFTGQFGADFTSDRTTGQVARNLALDVVGRLDATRLQSLASTTAPGAAVSLLPALPATYLTTTSAALEAPGAMRMNFTTIGSSPGNLAGGIGKTQTTCSVGATPSPQDDARLLRDVVATLVRRPDGSITVTPTFLFRVLDTVDLCPGDCGSSLGLINEQLATIPMSRLEASGVSGDVPFTVDFPSPAQAPFTVPPPAPPAPQTVTFSASVLFDFGADQLRPGAEAALLAQLGTRPAQADLTQPFVVEGHTDSRGSDAFNLGLSQRRAQRVADVLLRRFPALAGHVTPVGLGESRPVAPNTINGADNPAGRALNRRVELRFSSAGP